MRKAALTLAMLCPGFLLPGRAGAHLCDDVFRQARDNLAVKIDVRDGQLRIGREATFRVYVLNTMDRYIADLRLAVRSDEFDAEVKPSPDWRDFPRLRTAAPTCVVRGQAGGQGEKEYFTVILRRREGVPDGTYRIDLELRSDRRDRSFLSVSVDEAADLFTLPPAGEIVIDGTATRAEWGAAALCTDFTAHRRENRYLVGVPPRWPARVRVLGDRDNLYFFFNLQATGEISEDVVSIYAARRTGDTPIEISLDRLTGEVSGPPGAAGEIRWAASGDGTAIEVRVPRSLLGLEAADAFFLNFTRTTADPGHREVSYWRGNQLSYREPVIYAHFIPARD